VKQLISDAAAFDKAGIKPACDPRYDTYRTTQHLENDKEKDGNKRTA